jgi:hypothetical protein
MKPLDDPVLCGRHPAMFHAYTLPGAASGVIGAPQGGASPDSSRGGRSSPPDSDRAAEREFPSRTRKRRGDNNEYDG